MSTLNDTTDATVWAEEFCRIFDGFVVSKIPWNVAPEGDPSADIGPWLVDGTMIAWFANAIETGRNAGQGQVVAAQTNDDGTISLVTELDMDRDVRITPQLLVQMIDQHNRSVQGEPLVTYQMADGELIYGEFSTVTDLEFFDDRDEEIRLIKKVYRLLSEEELVLEDPYPIEEEDDDDEDPIVTKTGKVLTDADIQALADEAERGYDVSQLKERKRDDGETV